MPRPIKEPKDTPEAIIAIGISWNWRYYMACQVPIRAPKPPPTIAPILKPIINVSVWCFPDPNILLYFFCILVNSTAASGFRSVESACFYSNSLRLEIVSSLPKLSLTAPESP